MQTVKILIQPKKRIDKNIGKIKFCVNISETSIQQNLFKSYFLNISIKIETQLSIDILITINKKWTKWTFKFCCFNIYVIPKLPGFLVWKNEVPALFSPNPEIFFATSRSFPVIGTMKKIKLTLHVFVEKFLFDNIETH
jgi:hypothetical protein